MESLFIQGVEHTKSKHYSLALQCFSLAIQRQPSQQHLYINRGCVYLCMHMEQSAVDDFKEAISLDPYVHEAHFNRFIGEYRLGKLKQSQQAIVMCLFTCLLEIGQRTSSQELIKQTLQLIPNSGKAHMILGDLYKKAGRLQESIDVYNKVLSQGLEIRTVLGKKAEVLKALNRDKQYEQAIQKISSVAEDLFDDHQKLQVSIQNMDDTQRRKDIQLKLTRYYSLKRPKIPNQQILQQKQTELPSVKQVKPQSNEPSSKSPAQNEEEYTGIVGNSIVGEQLLEPVEAVLIRQENELMQQSAQGPLQVQLGKILDQKSSPQANSESHSVQYQYNKQEDNSLIGLEKQLGLSEDDSHTDNQDIDKQIEQAERQIKVAKMQFGDSSDSEDEPRSRIGSIVYNRGSRIDNNTKIVINRESEESETDQHFEK